MIWLIPLAGLLAVICWLGNGIRRIGAISNGSPIGPRTNTALILIDLQTVFWDDGPYSEADKVRAQAVIEKEVANARANNQPIIALRQEWSIPSTVAIARLTMKGEAVAGSQGTELATPFADLPDQALVKRVQDAFETGELDQLLVQHDIGALRLVGLDLNYCVQKTALAARNRGYAVTVVREGTLAAADAQKAVEVMKSRGVVFA